MSRTLIDSLAVAGSGCWLLCFWWMHRISANQNAMLEELRKQAGRIEKLSRAEHDLIKELHPKVENIEAGIGEVATAIKADKAP